MEPFCIGLVSLILIVVLIYSGSYVAITFSIVSFPASCSSSSDISIALALMSLSVTEGIKHYDYASIPTFVMMG